MKLCLAAKLTKDPDEARKKLNDCCNSAHKGLSYKQRQGSRNPSQAIWELKEQPVTVPYNSGRAAVTVLHY
eukprot:1340-Heterococcus_DN1.PRE.2